MKRQIAFLSLFIVFAIFIISCSKSSDSTPAPAATTSIVGNWGKTVQTYPLVLAITGNNTYSVSIAGIPGETGSYTTTASSVTFTASGGSGCSSTQGKYTYSISGNTLTLAVMSDSCTGRSASVIGAWTKQ